MVNFKTSNPEDDKLVLDLLDRYTAILAASTSAVPSTGSPLLSSRSMRASQTGGDSASPERKSASPHDKPADRTSLSPAPSVVRAEASRSGDPGSVRRVAASSAADSDEDTRSGSAHIAASSPESTRGRGGAAKSTTAPSLQSKSGGAHAATSPKSMRGRGGAAKPTAAPADQYGGLDDMLRVSTASISCT